MNMEISENAKGNSTYDESAEFIATLTDAPPSRLTACAGWTVHEITAHLTAGSQEIADLIEDHLDGARPRDTKPFELREAPYRAMDDQKLRDAFFEQVDRSKDARGRLEELPGDAVLFTGRLMSASEFVTHSRSERALHRWDIVGRDEIGWNILAQPELTLHALKILTEMPVLAEALANRLRVGTYGGGDSDIVIRSGFHDDVIISLSCGVLEVHMEIQTDRYIDVELDAASRLLSLWGRHEPSAPVLLGKRTDRALLGALFGW